MKRNWRLIAGCATAFGAVSTMGLSGAAKPAEAATLAPYFMQVNKSVRLRSEPAYGRDVVTMETPGQLLWVLPGGTYSWWHVENESGQTGYVVRNKVYASPSTDVGARRGSMRWYRTTRYLPPDSTVDPSIQPLAPRSATWAQKFAAVMYIANSKLGTPYRLDHNEDRGQFGFDCSNFTAYVYHHALGLKISGASLVQYHSVGWTVPKSAMRPGDLIIFEKGKHVGIYVGNHEMIEEGGGLGKVGYLSVKPGSYWGDHITVVKRIF